MSIITFKTHICNCIAEFKNKSCFVLSKNVFAITNIGITWTIATKQSTVDFGPWRVQWRTHWTDWTSVVSTIWKFVRAVIHRRRWCNLKYFFLSSFMIPSTYENHFVILLHILKIKVVLCLQIIYIRQNGWFYYLCKSHKTKDNVFWPIMCTVANKLNDHR